MEYLDRLRSEKEKRDARSGRRIVRDIVPPDAGEITIRARPAADKPRPRILRPPIRGAEPAPSSPLPHTPPSLPSAEMMSEVTVGPDLAVHTWEPEVRRTMRRRARILAGAIAAIIILAFILPTAVLPKISIIVYPKIQTTPINTVTFSADTAFTTPDVSRRAVPALAVSVGKTLSQEYDTSGKKLVQERARGTVLVVNSFSSSPQTLVANTRLQDSSGKVFRLVSSVTVPGAQIQDAKIVPNSVAAAAIADDVGPAYNIGPAEFRIPGFRGTPKYDGFYAKSAEPFAGGVAGEVKIVLSEDLKRASEDLTRRVIDELNTELQGKIPTDPDFVLPEGARETAVVRIDQPKPGDRRDRFSVTVTAQGRLFVIRRSHVASVLASALVSKTSDLPLEIPAMQDNLVITGAHLGPGPTQMSFAASGEFAFYHAPNTADLTAVLRTSTPAKAEAYLRGREEVGSFRIKRFPFWLWFIPSRAGGFEITVAPPQR